MALSNLAGRLRSIPDTNLFSASPISLPNGLITVHSLPASGNEQESDRMEKKKDKGKSNSAKNIRSNDAMGAATAVPVNKFNLKEIHFVSHESSVTDHCWATVSVRDDEYSSVQKILVLAVLSQSLQFSQGPGNTSSQTKKASSSERGSIVKLYRFADIGKSSAASHELISTIHMNIIANYVALNDRILAIGSSSNGISIHYLQSILGDIIIDQAESAFFVKDSVTIMPHHSVSALKIKKNFLMSASVDHIAVWSIDEIISYLRDPCDYYQKENRVISTGEIDPIWIGELSPQEERMTCLDMTDDAEFIAGSSWDGNVLVFRVAKEELEIDKDVQNSNEHYLKTVHNWVYYNPLPGGDNLPAWENEFKVSAGAFLPSFLSFCTNGDDFLSLIVASARHISTYDVRNGLEIGSRILSKDVQGMIITRSMGTMTAEKTIVSVDDGDNIYWTTVS